MKAWKGYKIIVVVCCLVIMMGLAAACAEESNLQDKVADLEFTVVPENEVPDELKKLIEEKKKNEFKLSYSDAGSLYIVVGYGEQKTGGYSICVKELYLTENAIVMDSDLLGPDQKEEVSKAPSYPYIVICTEDRQESIVFR